MSFRTVWGTNRIAFQMSVELMELAVSLMKTP